LSPIARELRGEISMCGRFTFHTPLLDWLCAFFPQAQAVWPTAVASLATKFPLLFQARYNIAPTQLVWVIPQRSKHGSSAKSGSAQDFISDLSSDPPEIVPMRWGLLPAWADSPRIAYTMINARCETLLEKPTYRPLVDSNRCIVIADGYYEWKQSSDSDKTPKQPFWIHHKSQAPLAFAGLWTINKKLDSNGILSATIVTTEANADTQAVHDRMPVLISPEEQSAGRWLNPDINAKEVADLLVPPLAGLLDTRAVSTRVNATRNQGPDLIEP
jgi:putative SOS response-associated peptidase YedK